MSRISRQILKNNYVWSKRKDAINHACNNIRSSQAACIQRVIIFTISHYYSSLHNIISHSFSTDLHTIVCVQVQGEEAGINNTRVSIS